jgi:hypothetical protein
MSDSKLSIEIFNRRWEFVGRSAERAALSLFVCALMLAFAAGIFAGQILRLVGLQ